MYNVKEEQKRGDDLNENFGVCASTYPNHRNIILYSQRKEEVSSISRRH